MAIYTGGHQKFNLDSDIWTSADGVTWTENGACQKDWQNAYHQSVSQD